MKSKKVSKSMNKKVKEISNKNKKRLVNCKLQKIKFRLGFNRKTGILLMVLGMLFQFLNIITYGLWKIDIDIFGAFIFLIGMLFTIIFWKKTNKI